MRAYPLEVRARNRRRQARPLSAGQIRSFLARGYLALDSSLPRAFHDSIFGQFHDLSESVGHFGNNLLPLVPELGELFEDPVVKGALGSLLGPDYLMHPHRALHQNPPGSGEQQFHKDSYWGYTRRVRNHRPWWVMVMYFPQDTPLELGPTSVMEGSQYLYQRPESLCEEVPVVGKAGRFVLIHYDIWHRKMLNQRDVQRYMFKFEFTRLTAPEEQPAGRWQLPRNRPDQPLEAAWRSHWYWLHGQDAPAEPRGRLTDWASNLYAEQELDTIAAGYELAAFGRKGLPPLIDALGSATGDNDNVRKYADDGQAWREDAAVRAAAHGLAAMGRTSLGALTGALAHGNAKARKHAAFALGENLAAGPAADRALIAAMQDDDIHVRIAATEALGLKPPRPAQLAALTHALTEDKSEVRFDAALSLVRAAAMGSSRQLARTIEPLGAALCDSNRYVSAHAADALERIGTDAAYAELIPWLRTARWCAHTDNKRPF